MAKQVMSNVKVPNTNREEFHLRDQKHTTQRLWQRWHDLTYIEQEQKVDGRKRYSDWKVSENNKRNQSTDVRSQKSMSNKTNIAGKCAHVSTLTEILHKKMCICSYMPDQRCHSSYYLCFISLKLGKNEAWHRYVTFLHFILHGYLMFSFLRYLLETSKL